MRLPEVAAASQLAEALGALNVTAGLLAVEQERLLDEQGFVFLPGLLEQRTALVDLARRFDDLVAFEGDPAGVEVHQEAGTPRLANLVDKGSMFDACWGHPMLLAAVAHVFGWRPFKLNSLNARAALPGAGHQRLHADSAVPAVPGRYQNCNSVWMLDDFTECNGAARFLPGSHRWLRLPADCMSDPAESPS